MSTGSDGNWRLNDIALQNRERAVLARKNRQAQLKKWSQYDKNADRELPKNKKPSLPPGAKAETDMVGSSIKSVTFGNNIVLLEAATREDYTEVRRLLSKGVSPDLCNEDGLTPLHQCSIDNSIQMCRMLLSFNANVNAKDSENWTPLHAASTCGHTELCKVLIDNNADLLALNADGNMPYDICDHEMTLDLIEREMATRNITQQQIDESRLIPEKTMLRELQQKFTSDPSALMAYDSQGATPLHIAAANGYCEVTHFLCSKRAPVNMPDKDEWLPIHIAACWGHLDVIELLVSFGGDLEARTKSGKGESVFDICEDGEMQEKLRQIQQDQENLRRFPSRNLIHRGSSRNPRSSHCNSIYDSTNAIRERSSSLSASVRRTSFRDKSLTSWREAKQEAEIRLSKELELQTLDGTVGAPVLTPSTSTEHHISSPIIETSSQPAHPTNQSNGLQKEGHSDSVKPRPVSNRSQPISSENSPQINSVSLKPIHPEDVVLVMNSSANSSHFHSKQHLNPREEFQMKELSKSDGDTLDFTVKDVNSSTVKFQGQTGSKTSGDVAVSQGRSATLSVTPVSADKIPRSRQNQTLPATSPNSNIINNNDLRNRTSSPQNSNALSKNNTGANSTSQNHGNAKINSTKKCCLIF